MRTVPIFPDTGQHHISKLAAHRLKTEQCEERAPHQLPQRVVVDELGSTTFATVMPTLTTHNLPQENRCFIIVQASSPPGIRYCAFSPPTWSTCRLFGDNFFPTSKCLTRDDKRSRQLQWSLGCLIKDALRNA